MPILATVQSVLEALLFFVPLLFFLVILVRGSRRKHGGGDGDAETDQSDR